MSDHWENQTSSERRQGVHLSEDPDVVPFTGEGRVLGHSESRLSLDGRTALPRIYSEDVRRIDSLDSQGRTVSYLRSSSRSPSIDMSFLLDLPSPPRRIHSSEDRRRSFYSAEERERRRSYYDIPGTSYMRRSNSDRRSDLNRYSREEHSPRRGFYVSESDSDVRLDEAVRLRDRNREKRERDSREWRRSLYERPMEDGRQTHTPTSSRSSESTSEEDRPPSAYNSCSSINDVVEKFKDYNRRVRDMVVNSLADIDDSMVINQGTSDVRQPQLGFHSIHGQNVALQNGDRIARRKESFCKGLAFSNRPISVGENVCLRLTEMAKNWSGVLRFGVTNIDPETYRGLSIPKFACPDLTSKEGYWAKALPERYSVETNILHFYVSDDGELFYGINGQQKGIFLSGINFRSPLWVIVDIYGNSVAVEFIDPSEFKPRGGLRTTSISSQPAVSRTNGTSSATAIARPSQTPTIGVQDNYVPTANSHSYGGVDLDLVQFHRFTGRHISLNSLRTLATRNESEYTQGYVFTDRPVRVDEKVHIQIVQTQQLYSGGLAFGVTCCDPQTLYGKELPDDSSDLIEQPEYFVGIKDVALGPKANTVLQFWITQSGQFYPAPLALERNQLRMLLVDQFSVKTLPCVALEGELKFQKDSASPRTIMYVDVSLQLYMWFDVYGSTQAIKVMGSCPVSRLPSRASPSPSPVGNMNTPIKVALPLLPSTSSRGQSSSRRSDVSPRRQDMGSLRVALEGVRMNETNQDASRIRRPALPPRRSVAAVEDLLSGDLPPSPHSPALQPMNATSSGHVTTPGGSGLAPGNPYISASTSSLRPPPIAPRQPMTQNRSAPSLPPTRPPPPPIPAPQLPAYGASVPISTKAPTPTSSGYARQSSLTSSGMNSDSLDDGSDECSVCMNAKINCVIYKCGHMCMCYDCAVETRTRNGVCPICRMKMDDVIKCFKS